MILAAMASLALASCEKKDPPQPDPDPTGTGKVVMEFFNKVGTADLVLNDKAYVNEHGDTFKVSLFKYYISNVKLNGAKGTYTETESYHLLDQADKPNMNFTMSNVPYDTYTSVTLTIGVDSTRNVSGAQTGALDPVKDMFWTWSTGYIMLKLEGSSPKSPATGGTISFHAGGYAGQYATQRTMTLSLPTAITVNDNGENHVHVDADVLRLFKAPTVFDFSALYAINSAGQKAKDLADNYANMLSVSYAGL
ncbi:hypothetical protein GCM10023093_03860 [Nemorincola caseinilytica]|uniref:Copper-binding protein MbnP-like domain-containing protein n=2 Tax=Nemorincola caseinilytica TaxID=2054315 RepID=A0ABP8N6I7_9BACT